MSAIYSILKELEATPSSNDKLAIMEQHKDNEVLKKCFELAYSPTINFFMKQLPALCKQNFPPHITLQKALTRVEEVLSKRQRTGNDAKAYYKHLSESMATEDQVVLNRVVIGDMKCGVGKTIANKVWKGLIHVTPRQGAVSMNEKSLKKLHTIKNLAIELKSDGSYAASVCGESSPMLSRNGNPLEIPSLQKHLSCGAFDGFALEGELVYDLTKATRECGNGYITKIVKGTAEKEHLDNVKYQVWDCIDTSYYEPKGTYPFSNKARRELLEAMIKEYVRWCTSQGESPRIMLIERKENVSVDEAMKVFEDYVKAGFEGAIAKDMDATWSDKAKPTYCIKVKRKEPADLRVVGVFEGKAGSKYVGMLGGLHCESECGGIKVDVGSGFTDEERKEFFSSPPPIIEVEYDSITQDKKTKQKSMFLPIYKRPRYDKDVGDTYEEVLDKVKIK